eukprot:COSAG03_NODE_3751_length_1846_cov_1.012021_1_plen_53_part_00
MARNGMDGSIVMDAADPAYHAHLLQMVEIMLSKVPESAGKPFACFNCFYQQL